MRGPGLIYTTAADLAKGPNIMHAMILSPGFDLAVTTPRGEENA